MRMSKGRLEKEVGAILDGSRAALRVSRARCYAMGSSGDYRLAASFGFASRFGPEGFLEASHPLVDWVQRHRKPAYANSPREAGRLGAAMEQDHYTRTLAVPVYVGSRLVGILELQDKLDGVFDSEDLRAAEKVGAQIAAVLEFFGGTSVAAPEPIPQEDAEALFRPQAAAGANGAAGFDFAPPSQLFSPGPENEKPPRFAAPLSPAAPAPAAPATPARGVEILYRGFWGGLLLVPDVEAVAFSTWTAQSADIRIGARRPLSDRARGELLDSLAPLLKTAMAGARPPEQKRFSTEYPLGRAAGEIPGFAGIQTSVLMSGARAVLVSVLFSQPPAEAAQEALKDLHRAIRAAVSQAAVGDRYRDSYRSLVKTLLERGVESYPQVKSHGYAVGGLCRRFATALKLPADAIEQLTVAGLLHDIGIREVDVPYERLSGRRALDLQEVALIREHAVIAADILEQMIFPYPIAPLIRHHHERFDGAGYPDGLSGDRIPFGSRVLAIADAYDAMTAAHSYRAAISPEAALEIISLKGGMQFDPELARRFCELMRSSVAGPSRSAALEMGE
jgi:HD domain/GAF domain